MFWETVFEFFISAQKKIVRSKYNARNIKAENLLSIKLRNANETVFSVIRVENRYKGPSLILIQGNFTQ